MEEGYERHYMKITDADNTQQGLACVNIEQNIIGTGVRAYLRHLSVLDMKDLDQALEKVIEFIWQRIACDHIRTDIMHFENSKGQVTVDPEVKKAYAAHKFKWKSLKNFKGTNRRAQIMQC